MEKWQGIITFKEHSINATVLFKRPEQYNLGEWSGYGKLQGLLSAELIGKLIDTNIGSIIINKLSYDSRAVEFRGTGPIKGPLADALDKVK